MERNKNLVKAEEKPDTDIIILAGLSLSLFFYHIITSAVSHKYGYFIDELYYIACSKRLAFGYVDHPPLSVWLLSLSRFLFGESLPALRLFSSLAISATVFIAGLTVRLLGGSRRAVIISALAVIAMPVYMIMGSFYSMNAYEPLVFISIIYFLVRILKEENLKHWIWIGILLGAGLELKHTMIIYAAALFAGMLFSGSRRLVLNKWFLLGMLISLLLILPNIIWQYINGFPSLEFYRNAMMNKNVPRSVFNVILDQIIYASPFTFPLWLTGLVYLLSTKEVKRYRFLAFAYLLLLLIMITSQSSRPDRIAAIYSSLYVFGALAIEKLKSPILFRSAAPAVIILLIAGAAAFAPLATPLLPPHILRSYMSLTGFTANLEKGKMNEPIPQWLADRLGWHDLAADVGKVYHSLIPGEKQNAVIVSTNYGEAGALELYGKEFDLPPVFATHNSYHLWGPPADSVKTFIAVFVDYNDIKDKFESVTEAAVHTCSDCTGPQRTIPIYIARGPRFSMKKEWTNFKIYN